MIDNVICENAFVETEPFYHQGVCLVQDLYFLSFPCKHNDGNYSCTQTTDEFELCKGYSLTAQQYKCDE